MDQVLHYHHQENYTLESGRIVTGLHLAYQTFGKLNAAKDNAIWVVHALTGNSNPNEWWPGVVGHGKAIDPEDHFIICVNNPGSPYGSISPLSVNAEIGKSYYHDFPVFTTRDIANIFNELRISLELDTIKLLIGASLGGQIAMEWAIVEPALIQKLILIATNARQSAWGIAFNESQRMAIEADQSWVEPYRDAGARGLKAARSIAMLSYRTYRGYKATQKDEGSGIDDFRAASYQRYQGDKLVNRFDAHCYYTITKTMDSHNVARMRSSAEEALGQITAQTLVIGISTDFLFPTSEQRFLAEAIPEARYAEIHSDLGHDGFLTESEKVGRLIRTLLTAKKKTGQGRLSTY
ncbi:MAG: homoserine O-acetyltransferase [Saprospiraceae bacterium]|nr:homoserine O-acetyltransferase [Saprospiraceae bacterium]